MGQFQNVLGAGDCGSGVVDQGNDASFAGCGDDIPSLTRGWGICLRRKD
jgi:hypothetical protein